MLNAITVRGNVSAEGERTAGHNFKVLKMSTGKYAVTFDRDFPETPSVVVTIIGDEWRLVDNAHVHAIGTDRVIVTTGDYYGQYGDRPFSFIATA
ncbi:hypothetical protein [Streptomyces pratensis]|uniref:hypothetical protein n=1 Tax=Streptomyces pratensis TaxID=1169025 RepID=UPI001933916B|nr:hypothetical protein [Streptomyces pratensis]